MAFSYKSSSLFLYPLLLCSVCFIALLEATKNGGITLDLIHRDSPRSPSYDPLNTHFQRLRNAFHRSFSRKSSLRLTRTSASLESVQATITPDGGEYLMRISIGTPPVEQLGIADTGSDLTWTQCQPCSQCYKQNDPIFDPRKTKTYRRVSCQSEQCAAVGSAACDSRNGCQYQVSYGDRSYSIGDLAVETFTFGSNENATFSKVVFGCGHQNDGTFSRTGSGIVGLGGGPLSIINQLKSSINGKFSYCLTFLDSNVSSTISFGSDAVVTGPNVRSTPLVKKTPDTFYYLTLEGVSVGRERLEFKSRNVKAEVEEGNIIIDSGTTLTFLPSEFYQGVEAALVRAIKGKRVSDPQGLFGLCYQRPSGGESFSSPPITAHFRGADLVLPEGSTFLEVERGVVCLTLVPSEDLAIYGNLHQMNYQIGYDLVGQEVNFLPTDCSKSQ